MNYITSCPACETQFLLNKAQLKSHRGKVQCGNCEHIFNAKNRLTEISDDIRSPAEYQASLESQEQDEELSAETIPNENGKPIDEVLNIVLDGVPDLADLEAKSWDSPQANSPFISDPTPTIIEDLSTDSKFNQPKTKTNKWLVPASLLLALLAGLQSAYAMRTKIAAEYPQYKPYLVQTCVALKCEIELPKNLELLTIDDSDMQEDEKHQNVIKFSSLLINNASFTQAYPNIELTLTDTADQPVLRKVIKPAEYLTASSNAASGIYSREEIRINLAINVTDLAVAGYRVLLVY
jgi:predicted Zn finger-like uncharacterized protein